MPIALIWHNLRRHWLRTGLTMASIVVAVFLVCFLRTMIVALNAGIEASANNRLWVQSAVSLFVDLPLSYQSRIAAVPGVEETCKFQWFQGTYIKPSNFFAQFGVDAEKVQTMWPEMKLVEGSYDAFVSDPLACLVGVVTARRFDWKIGDIVELEGTIFPRPDKSPWTMRVAAIYDADNPSFDKSMFLFHHDYLRKALESGEALGQQGVGVYVARIAPGTDATAVMAAIDELYENGPQRVQTTTEAEFNRQFVSMMGNIPTFLRSIGGGVAFAILLAALNTMLMAGRERTRDFGIMKAIGFRDSTAFGLLLGESLLVCGLAGALGLALFVGSAPVVAEAIARLFPGYRATPETIAVGAALALGVGLIAGILPAWQAGRLRPVEALRQEA
ncbi:MAG: ABC transporter permease [Planctomycetota bacterium]|nr:MAG: ABC transporter permease [Planctomycetota bacterium]